MAPLQRAAAGALALLLLTAAPGLAEFRDDELDPRDFEYSDDNFINVFSYRHRLSHRWRWANAASPRWRWFWSDNALGYQITAGSLTTDELYLHQEAIVRLPWSNNITGEYRFIETEDYDERYLRNEVEVLFRFFRPAYSLPLLATVGRTPPEDGLFFGGQGLLDAEKWHADIGWVAGYRGATFGIRLDVIQPDYWFNAKNPEDAEYTTEPLTLRAKVGALLLDGDLELLAWFEDDLPLRGQFPERGDIVGRYRQLEAGAAARWRVTPGVRLDADVYGERTRKRRRSTTVAELNDAVNREAGRFHVAGEVDVVPLIGSSSRGFDVVLFAVAGHGLNEQTYARNPAAVPMTVRRGELYVELGYVLGLPTFDPEYVFGLRMSTQNGIASLREVQETLGVHSVNRRFLSKIGLGPELELRNGLGVAFFQLTFRVDELTFGGGNAQIMMRF